MTYKTLQPILATRGLDVVKIHGKQVLKKLDSSAMVSENLVNGLPRFYSLSEVAHFIENNPNFTWETQKYETLT
jgi:hypothetical protein